MFLFKFEFIIYIVEFAGYGFPHPNWSILFLSYSVTIILQSAAVSFDHVLF